MTETSPNNASWKRLFEKLPIKRHLEDSGIFHISAKQIKDIGEREPRLMTKFDSRKHRPKLLMDSNVTILPISNGKYVLLKGDGYFDVPVAQNVQDYSATRLVEMQTLPWRSGIRGESQAIDVMFMASILRTFTGDPDLQLTMRGRLGSRRFSFYFQTETRREQITADGVTIEVDSGFEGRSVAIVEAKFGTIDSFIVRQLYYPTRDLMTSGVTKPIAPILMVYSNKVFSLYLFSFPEPNSYQSIRLVRQASYSLDEQRPLPRLADLLTRRRKKAPQGIPFPQADDITKVIDITEILTSGPSNKEQIAERFDVDPRQGDYYGNAAVWVGLAEKSKGNYQLSLEGKAFALKTRNQRIVWISERLCELPVFHEVISAIVQGGPMDNAEIARVISRETDLTGVTPKRRAVTARAWVAWIEEQLKGTTG
jgi:hypothetical protein